jgi:NAD+ synthase (glutamine-hydrolysing)
MLIALAQINTTVGDVAGNTERAIVAVRNAAQRGARLVVLPELTLAGYPPLDLVERRRFVEACELAVQRVADASRDMYTIVGHLARVDVPGGKPTANAASLVRDGEVIARRDKMLLPNYDVFDETRLFRPAAENTPVDIDGLSVGITICEDAWNDAEFWPTQEYERDPVAELAARGAELLVNLSASPFAAGKQGLRRAMFSATAARHSLPTAYVNLVGGNDQLIFAGRSVFFDARGRIAAEGASFAEDAVLVDTDACGLGEPPQHDDVADIWQALVLGVRDYARKCGFDRAVLALSGGIDSALTAAIAAEAFGPQNLTTIFMPTEFSSEQSRSDAEEMAGNVGAHFRVIPIDALRIATEGALAPLFRGMPRGIAEENIQARIRGGLVMAFANKFGYLPLATGNKSELAVGYCTLYGDMVGGLAVIGDVPKVMVYRLCEYANRARSVIPQSTITKPPSAELKPDQTDQDVLPPYDLLDAILERYIEGNMQRAEIIALGYDAEVVRRVLQMVDRAEFKRRQAPMALRVTSRAFGLGRRLPIAQKFDF